LLTWNAIFSANENVLGDLWIKFLEGDWQRGKQKDETRRKILR